MYPGIRSLSMISALQLTKIEIVFSSAPVVRFYDTSLRTRLQVDASKSGLGIGVRAGGGEGGCSPPKFWATQIFWAARENLGKASF